MLAVDEIFRPAALPESADCDAPSGDREFPRYPSVAELLREAFGDPSYRRGFAHRLLAWARPGPGRSWELRCLAVLLLQEHILRIPPDDHAGLEGFLVELGLKLPGDPDVRRSLLKEGYGVTDYVGFAAEFRRKLARSSAVFERLRRDPYDGKAVDDLLYLSRRECKLALARYVFTPREVVERILSRVRLSTGKTTAFCGEENDVRREIRHTFASLPDYETEILRWLMASPSIYWVTDETSSELNALVEYPLGTVVLVVKPPGSELEIEIKRTGRRGERPLGVIYKRNGYRVANMHRLDGGSSLHFLKNDASAASRFSQIFRHIHGGEAPISTTVAIAGISNVPTPRGEVCLFDYFTEAEMSDDELAGMRRAMAESIEAFENEWGSEVSDLPGELGLTVQFLTQIPPAQAILTGTSSLRLDLAAGYLSERGPELYFGKKGLGIDPNRDDGRRLADEVLSEVLGGYEPPEVPYEDHTDYVAAAFAVKSNKKRARRIYRALMEELGRVWGTLLAVRGCSFGESFVARNLGLRTVWQGGRFRVKLFFMDHDSLQIPRDFDPDWILTGTAADERFIFGRTTVQNPKLKKGSAGFLAEIYRISPQRVEKGRQAFYTSQEAAYRRTSELLASDPGLRSRFSQRHLETGHLIDQLIAGYLELAGKKRKLGKWKKSVRRTLKANGFKKRTVVEYFKAIEKHSELLQKYAFLYPRLPSSD